MLSIPIPTPPPDTLPVASRRALASIPESRVGHQPTALLAADVVIVSALGAPDPTAAAGGVRAGQLVLLVSDEPPDDSANAMLDVMLERARIVRAVDVAVAWITIGPELDVAGTDAVATELARRFLSSLPMAAPPVVVTLVDDGSGEAAADHDRDGSGARERSLRESAAQSSVDHAALGSVRVSVLLPCHNEASTIGNVVRSFRAALPSADVYVYDNASTDGTGLIAREAGAIVRHSPALGKGNVVRRMFAEIDADVYVLADGDETYEVGAAPELIRQLRTQFLDMVVGRRVETADAAHVYPPGHRSATGC